MTNSLLTNLDDIKAALSYLAQKSTPICVDTETDGLKRNRRVIGIGFASSEEESFYIPLLIYKDENLVSPWPEEVQKELLKEFKKFFSLPLKWIGHNIVFDIITIENYCSVNIVDNVHCDTQALAHLVHNEEGPLGLKPLSTELFNIQASESQDEVKESVKKNGGKVSKENFELYKGDWELIGKYCGLDCHFTYKLYNKFYNEIEKQNFTYIWENEIRPLIKVTYELNAVGFHIDKLYFDKLKTEIELNIKEIESKIFNEIESKIEPYVRAKVMEETNLTSRSKVGRLLLEKGIAELDANKNLIIKNEMESYNISKSLYEQKKPLFNLDSNDDKAYLLYEVLKLPCENRTESGKAATDAKTLNDLAERCSDNNVIKLLLERSKERKILSTYVEPILENEIEGKIYTSFRQTGTLSGRYSSGDPINFQNLPRDDKRIKKGFIPHSNKVLIGSDYESAEPKAFAHISGEESLKTLFEKNLDFYSTVAIQVENIKGVSANPKDKNYLKLLYPEKRQEAKAYSLGVAYGMKGGKLAKVLNIDYLEAKELVDNYLRTYPKLHDWMKKSEDLTLKLGYVTSIYGRKRRAKTVHSLYKKYGITEFSKYSIANLVKRYGLNEDPLKLYLECNNNLNNAKNFQIQSICASVINKAMIEFIEKRDNVCPSARILMMVHDEIIIETDAKEAEQASRLLKDCMESNDFTKQLTVGMKADPVITSKSLAEAK